MKKNLLLLLFSFMTLNLLFSQTVILDFESDSTSTTFQYFGSTIDGTLDTIIANPDKSGINTSDNVSLFIKPAEAQTWAGAFSNPNPQIPVDLTTGGEVCIKVWFNEPGNLALKLENGTNPNWIQQLDVTETGQWVELCFDSSLPSMEAPNSPASGGVYNTITLFFNFGDSPATDQTFYFDDIIVNAGVLEPVDLTFNVDMNNYTGSFTTVYVSGTFNSWSGDANPMTDDDGDGIWTTTVMQMPAGAHEYKFQVDNWSDSENFNGANYSCTVTDPSGQYVNRKISAFESDTLPAVCWGSCYACGNGILVTVNLGKGDVEPSPEGFFIAGGDNFGVPGDFPLADQGNGTYSATFEKETGFQSYYTFTNGACGDWSCKENIGGQNCANPDHYNDRLMGPIFQDTTIATCFGLCTTSTDCGSASKSVKLEVDMSNYTESFTNVYIAGNFNNWSGDANALTDDDGDSIWTTTIDFLPGTYQFKFELDNWAVSEEFDGGEPCTITDGGFVNRVITIEDTMSVCYQWNSCDACNTSNVIEMTNRNNLFEVIPTIVDNNAIININEDLHQDKYISVYNSLGIVVAKKHLSPNQFRYELQTEDYQNGMYFINLQTGTYQQTSRIFVNK
ncbi:MAG TPA: T9SS type A sorting domain-containing protein [Bacteroidetes bacterium]|nr:T9SS type A sorting domain-containing protein [Bacteroidota bacterium]